MWDEESIKKIVSIQRNYFRSGETLPLPFRRQSLLRLKESVKKHEEDICLALKEDLGRDPTESYLFDIGPTLFEIDEAIKNLKKWARPETHFSGLSCFPSLFTKVYKLPFGVSLIISPFNFPFLLSLGVLCANIAAGNTAILKASSKSKASTEVLKKIIKDAFEERYVTVVDGGHDIADLCLAQRFDKIFYTGSPNVGKHVMEMAAKNLTPVTLELGGENGNWAIVRKDADLKDAARKIAFFKIANAGQICINVNQVAVEESIAEEFIVHLKTEFQRQIGENPCKNEEFDHLINRAAFEKCSKEARQYQDKIVYGGRGDETNLRFEPTILYPIQEDEGIVNHELFSPLLPIVPYKENELDALLKRIEEREHGLALYLFTKDKHFAKRVMSTSQYGGGCVNEVCLHLMVKGVPFGGVGHSGMGSYHGKWGFDEFSHRSSVLFGKTKGNLSLREHPYKGSKKAKIIKAILK